MLLTKDLEQVVTVGDKKFLICLKREESVETLESLNRLVEIYAESENIWKELKSISNWGNGWEWEEFYHPKCKRFNISDTTSWFAQFGSNIAPVEAAEKLGIKINGQGLQIKMRQKNYQPYEVGYLFQIK